MSRIGKNPITIPSGVFLEIDGARVSAKGPMGKLDMLVAQNICVTIDNNTLIVRPKGDLSKKARQMWGTTRMLLYNLVLGVSVGFSKKLEINGVGYRAVIQGDKVKLNLGFSHEVFVPIPSDIKINVEGDRSNIINIFGISKQRVGQIASEIRAFRPPEPYKGKGIKYLGERIVRKEGKKK